MLLSGTEWFPQPDGCYHAKFEEPHFAKGACRFAFRGKLFGQTGKEPMHWQFCVIKAFQDGFNSNAQRHLCDWYTSKKSIEFANCFMADIGDQNFCNDTGTMVRTCYIPSIEFVLPVIARIEYVWLSRSFLSVGDYVAIERFLDGTYDKFNSNDGFEDVNHPNVTAFTHYTWAKSCMQYMVCDLQGVFNGMKYILTDPAIHSVKREFGMTDLGEYGMFRVLVNHQCNFLCNRLGLTNPFYGMSIPNYLAPQQIAEEYRKIICQTYRTTSTL